MLKRAPPWRRRCLATLPDEERRPAVPMQQWSERCAEGRSGSATGCARDVAHLFDVWMCANDAGYAAQHSSSSRKSRLRSCTFTHAKLGQSLHKEKQSSMHACCMDCSLTCAAWRLMNALGTVGCVGAVQGVWEMDCAEHAPPVQRVQLQPQIQRVSSNPAAFCSPSRALQAAL
jgi:hypothetical protein